MSSYSLRNRTCVITGAAGGIGRALAQSLARRGAHLAICDVNDAGLAETAAAIRTEGLRLSTHHLDVGDAAAIAAFPDAVLAEHPGVDVVINNAGVAIGGSFEDTNMRDFEWLFNINFWGVVRMTKAFLPLLHRSDDARLVNISSLFGIVAPPGQSAYSASKFAVRGFSQSLRGELEGTTVGVTTVHPGGVATSIAKSARLAPNVSAELAEKQQRAFSKMLRMPPEEAGEIIVGGVERRRARIIVGRDAQMAALVERLMPVSYGKHFRFMRPRR